MARIPKSSNRIPLTLFIFLLKKLFPDHQVANITSALYDLVLHSFHGSLLLRLFIEYSSHLFMATAIFFFTFLFHKVDFGIQFFDMLSLNTELLKYSIKGYNINNFQSDKKLYVPPY